MIWQTYVFIETDKIVMIVKFYCFRPDNKSEIKFHWSILSETYQLLPICKMHIIISGNCPKPSFFFSLSLFSDVVFFVECNRTTAPSAYLGATAHLTMLESSTLCTGCPTITTFLSLCKGLFTRVPHRPTREKRMTFNAWNA